MACVCQCLDLLQTLAPQRLGADGEQGEGSPTALIQSAGSDGLTAAVGKYPASSARGAAVPEATGAAGSNPQLPNTAGHRESGNQQHEQTLPQEQQEGERAKLQHVMQAAMAEVTGCDASTCRCVCVCGLHHLAVCHDLGCWALLC
jgi:hypothetical protein